MGLITERNGADDGYEEVSSGVILRRRSALPSRRAVLYVHGQRDTFVPEDLVAWYTERGFHFYVADLRPPDGLDKPPEGPAPRRMPRPAGLGLPPPAGRRGHRHADGERPRARRAHRRAVV